LHAQLKAASWRAPPPEPTAAQSSYSLPDIIAKECAKCRVLDKRVSEQLVKLQLRDVKLKDKREKIASMEAEATEHRATIKKLEDDLKKAKQEIKEMLRRRESSQRGRSEERAENEVSDARGFAPAMSQLSTRGGYLSREPRWKDDTRREDTPTRRPRSGGSRSPSPTASAYLKRVTSAGRERPPDVVGASTMSPAGGSFLSAPSAVLPRARVGFMETNGSS